MLRDLLVERFSLAARLESRETPIYALVVSKGGSRLKESPTDANQSRFPPEGFPRVPPGSNDIAIWATAEGNLRVTAQRKTMGEFADSLSYWAHRDVRDETGIKGSFDFTLEYRPDDMRPVSPVPGVNEAAPVDPAAGPTLFEALQKQMGLRLESRKGPVYFLVIEHVDRTPTGN